jgi:hypothetical protein
MKKFMNIVAVTVLLAPAALVKAEEVQDNGQVTQIKPTGEENKEDAQPYGKCSKGNCTKPGCKGGSCGR